MEKLRESPLRKAIIWSYERGTLPYDIICGLILAFIFFVPRSCFIKPRNEVQKFGTHGTAIQTPANPGQSMPAGGAK